MVNERTTLQVLRKFLILALTLAITLAACAPQQATENPERQVATSVAMTVSAQNAETAAAQPLTTATTAPTEAQALVLPTLTPIILPTVTPFVASSGSGGSSGGSGSGGGGSSSGSQKYLCTLVSQTPNDGSPATILKVGDALDVKWTLRNDGTKTWESTWLWSFYSSAVDTNVPSNSTLTMSSVGFQTSLGTNVKPGQTITLGVELTAPNFEGRDPIRIGTAWTIIGDGTKFCKVDINVEVIRPGMTP